MLLLVILIVYRSCLYYFYLVKIVVTDECAKKESQVMVVKQRIRNTNEGLFIAKTRTEQNQSQHDGLVEELAGLKCALEKSKNNIEKVEALRVDFQVEKAIHEDRVKQVETWKCQQGIGKEIEDTQREVEVLEEYSTCMVFCLNSKTSSFIVYYVIMYVLN